MCCCVQDRADRGSGGWKNRGGGGGGEPSRVKVTTIMHKYAYMEGDQLAEQESAINDKHGVSVSSFAAMQVSMAGQESAIKHQPRVSALSTRAWRSVSDRSKSHVAYHGLAEINIGLE